MPPAGPALTAAEIATLRAWIDNGAPWPATARKPAAAELTRQQPHHAGCELRRERRDCRNINHLASVAPCRADDV